MFSLFLLFCSVGMSSPAVDKRREVDSSDREWARALGRKSLVLRKAAKRAQLRPVFFIPGVAGSVLEQRLTNVKQPHSVCTSNQEWGRVWLRLSNLVPVIFDCFANTISMAFDAAAGGWHDKPGVETRPAAGLNAIDYLDDVDFITRRATRYFELTTEAFIAAGYRVNETLWGVPYDWRRIPEDLQDTWTFLQGQIEATVKSTGLRVVLVSHSMGGPMTHYFLTQVVSAEWKDAHIETWFACAPPTAGAPVAVKALLSGYNFGIPVLTSSEGHQVQPNSGSVYFLLPKPGLWDTLVTLQHNGTSTNYTSSQMEDLLMLTPIPDVGLRLSKSTGSWGESLLDPGVRVVIVAGSEVDTESAFIYSASNLGGGPTTIVTESGDGTVPLRSALLGTRIWNQTSSKVFPGVEHVRMLSDGNFISWLLANVNE